jgi:hypothetical protein
MNIRFLAEHQTFFQILQWGLMLWLSGRLLAFGIFGKHFHSRIEMISYYVSWLIAATGLVVNYWEPFKSDNQILAEQHFERLRNHRQLSIQLAVPCDAERLQSDLTCIDGVRKGSVNVKAHAATLSYHKNMVTPDHIYTVLRAKGYAVR